MFRYAGIVLCGGKGRRMGRAKAMLPFGPETMLQRVVRLLGEAVDLTVVTAARGQELPELPPSVIVVHDRNEDRGPLEGLAAGLRALGDRDLVSAGREGGPAQWVAFVTACDLPLLRPAFVRRMFELSAGHEIAVPHVGGFDQPLSAVYRASVLAEIEALLAAQRLRPAYLFDRVRTRRVTAEELTDVDPHLQSLAGVNRPEDYAAALRRAGLRHCEPGPVVRGPGT